MGVIFLSNCISVSLSLCSCIPLYNFSYIYEYIMSTPTSFVDRWVSWLRYIDVRILKIISCWLSPVHHSLLQDLCGYLKLATFCSGIRWLFYVLRNINVSLKWSYLCYSLLRYMRYILLSFWFGAFCLLLMIKFLEQFCWHKGGPLQSQNGSCYSCSKLEEGISGRVQL